MMASSHPAVPVIELEKCDGCALCVPACPASALAVSRGKVRMIRTDCEYCGECEAACPTGAISCPFEIVLQ